jgi:hypothetical protein
MVEVCFAVDAAAYRFHSYQHVGCRVGQMALTAAHSTNRPKERVNKNSTDKNKELECR